ncbi:CAP domain-containing protein [Priestia aryabhattai]|uniref:CAP domain-containing protein n=1 Tax=Priestia aryabhattai TaxID=412384 RepID=UPI000532F47D|nr:CAP domain-containing protein [Priestia aryabhattai]
MDKDYYFGPDFQKSNQRSNKKKKKNRKLTFKGPNFSPNQLITPMPTRLTPISKVNNDTFITKDISGGNTSLESTAINLINEERKRNGLSPLQVDPTLNKLAMIKAQDMLERGNSGIPMKEVCDHYSPTIGGNKSTLLSDEEVLLSKEGIRNVAMVGNVTCGSGPTRDTAEDAVTAWINSPEHYANMLDKNVTRIGIGRAYSSQNDTNYWSMIATSDFQSAAPQKGWIQQNGKWYYYVNGIAQTGWVQIDDYQWQFDNNGVWTQWRYKEPYYYKYDGTNWSTYYYDAQNNQWSLWNGTTWVKV